MYSHSTAPIQGIDEKDEDVSQSNITPEKPMKGELSQEMRYLLKVGLIATLIAIFGVAAFALIGFFAVPFALSVCITSVFVGSVMYLGAISYGIINDIIGANNNLPYFSLGHQPGQKGLIKSNDPNAVGIAWGIFATAPLAIPAAILFTAASLLLGFFVPIATFFLPLIIIAMPIVLIAACVKANRANKARQEYLKNTSCDELMNDEKFTEKYFDDYQKPRLKKMLKTTEDVNAWFTNSDRNVGGFIGLPILGLVGLASIITLSAAYYVLPAILFTATFAVFPPLAVGLLLAVGVIAACCYLAVKHDKQANNKFKLDYELEDHSKTKQVDATSDEKIHLRLNQENEARPNLTNTTFLDSTPVPSYSSRRNSQYGLFFVMNSALASTSSQTDMSVSPEASDIAPIHSACG